MCLKQKYMFAFQQEKLGDDDEEPTKSEEIHLKVPKA